MDTTNSSLPNSESFGVDLHLFQCGHGDTLLLGLPGPKWALVDCCLPKHDGTFNAFVSFLNDLRVQKLDWVFLTHPDTDHFLGMRNLLEAFTRDGRSLGYWLSSGLNAQEIRALAFPDDIDTGLFQELSNYVSELANAGLLRRAIVTDTSRTTSPIGFRNRIDLVPIAPSAETLFRIAAKSLPKRQANPKARIQANALSVILVISINDGDQCCNFLLSADAGPAEIQPAIEIWRERANELEREPTFRVIKVPHHGSVRSHWTGLLQLRSSEDPCIAAISAGGRPKIPDRSVISDYVDAGWTVASTTCRTGPARQYDHAFMLAGRRGASGMQFRRQSIRIRWNSLTGFTCEPNDAIVRPDELHHYESAQVTGGVEEQTR